MSKDLIDVRSAARLSGRHPETIRRWVRSGKLRQRAQGRRLFVDRAELVALCGPNRESSPSLARWRDQARAFRAEPAGDRAPRSSADLVLANRSKLADLDWILTPEEAMA